MRFFSFSFFGTENQSQDLAFTRQAQFHWAISLAPDLPGQTYPTWMSRLRSLKSILNKCYKLLYFPFAVLRIEQRNCWATFLVLSNFFLLLLFFSFEARSQLCKLARDLWSWVAGIIGMRQPANSRMFLRSSNLCINGDPVLFLLFYPGWRRHGWAWTE